MIIPTFTQVGHQTFPVPMDYANSNCETNKQTKPWICCRIKLTLSWQWLNHCPRLFHLPYALGQAELGKWVFLDPLWTGGHAHWRAATSSSFNKTSMLSNQTLEGAGKRNGLYSTAARRVYACVWSPLLKVLARTLKDNVEKMQGPWPLNPIISSSHPMASTFLHVAALHEGRQGEKCFWQAGKRRFVTNSFNWNYIWFYHLFKLKSLFKMGKGPFIFNFTKESRFY